MRYFFDVFMDGDLLADTEGKELKNLEAAQEEAAQLALELKRECPRDSAAAIENVIEVHRDDGRRLMAIPIYTHLY